MSDVEVAYGDNPSNTAVLLLAAVEELGLDPGVVRSTTRGVFMVPEEVEAKAFGKEPAKKAPAKKAAAKKTAAKKVAAKKTKE